jgi:peptide deformylase
MDPKDFKLRLDPDPILYQKLEDLDIDQYDLPAIEQAMIYWMKTFNGIGIAANQVGFDKRVIVVKPKGKEPFAMFNPKVINISEDEIPDEEGCLSFPNLFISIKRPKKIEVEFIDKNKNSCIMLFEGYDSKCVQHELDHIDGICFVNRVSPMKLALAKKKQRKYNGRTK